MAIRPFFVRYVLVPLAWFCVWGSVDTALKVFAGLLWLSWNQECWEQSETLVDSRGFEVIYWLCMASFLGGAILSRPLKSRVLWCLTSFWLYMGLVGLLVMGIVMIIGILWIDSTMGWLLGPEILLVAFSVPFLMFLAWVPGVHYILFYRWKPLGMALQAGTTSTRPAMS